MRAGVSFGLLGPLEIACARKPNQVLEILLVHRGQPVAKPYAEWAMPPANAVHHAERVLVDQPAPLATQGADAGKKIVGRKRGLVTDTLGPLLAVVVTAASVSDNAIGADLLDQATTTHPPWPRPGSMPASRTPLVEHGAALGIDVEVVTKDPTVKGLSVVNRSPVPVHSPNPVPAPTAMLTARRPPTGLDTHLGLRPRPASDKIGDY